MVKAVIPRIQGDDYQYRWFWLEVCRMFEDRSKVIQVGLEAAGSKAFDDVITHYGEGMTDDYGNPLSADYYQVKFHVTAAGAFTHKALIDPEFINATKVSLLQRLRDGQRQFAPDGTGVQFIILSPWAIHPDDPLARLISLTNGSIRWQTLAVGGPNSTMGKIRNLWREHLGLSSDEELRVVLMPLRIRTAPQLSELKRTLNLNLRLAGLLPVPDGQLSHHYDELARKLLEANQNQFTRLDIEQICRREKLWKGTFMQEPEAFRLGIRSFLRWAEHLEDQTDAMLSLLEFFDGRTIKTSAFWDNDIFPKVRDFLTNNVSSNRRYHIILHTHASIAFAAGYCLDSKAGFNVIPVQSTATGPQLWLTSQESDETVRSRPNWVFSEEHLSETGSEVALAVSLTHDLGRDVKTYVAGALPEVRRVISAILPDGASNSSVLDGAHAKFLADQLSNFLKKERTDLERAAPLHIFVAAPNGFLFFLGQLARSFGRCTLYEYDFETNLPGAYQPSITFPPVL